MMKIETLTEKIKNGKFSAIVDYGSDTVIVDVGYGGEPFATATAWHDHGAQGRLHWVGVDAAHQGMGLSKPLVSLALQRLREVGYRSAMLTTQTASWVAIKVYHRFGFRPLLRKCCEAEGWKIVSDKTGIDFLQYL